MDVVMYQEIVLDSFKIVIGIEKKYINQQGV